MNNRKLGKIICARAYELLRENYSNIVSERFKGKPSGRKGKHLTKEWRTKISSGVRRAFTPEVLKRISEGTKRGLTPEAKRKISESNKGRKLSEEAKRKISLKNKGRIRSELYKKHMSEIKQGVGVGRIWVNDGKTEILIYEKDGIPENFNKGRIYIKRKHRTTPAWNKGKKCKQLSDIMKRVWAERKMKSLQSEISNV